MRSALLRLRFVPLCALVLPLLGGRCTPIDAAFGVLRTDGRLPVEIQLQAGQDPASAFVTLDGTDVTADFSSSGASLRGSVALPPPGLSTLAVSAAVSTSVPGLAFRETQSFPLLSPAASPALAGVDPAPVAGAVSRTAWLRLRFAAPLPPAALDGPGFGVECNGVALPRRIYRATETAVILDPMDALPPGARCRVAWRGPAGTVLESRFDTASDAATPARVLHDREDPTLVAPFPDDFYSVEDSSTRTGRHVSIPEPPYGGSLLQVYQGVLEPTNALDGWSRVSPIVIAFSHGMDTSLAPQDEFGSQDPYAPIALFDVDPGSPDYGKRIPYAMRFRTDFNRSFQLDFSALLFPSIALRPRGHYAVVVTRRLFAFSTPGRTLEPSAFFTRAAGPPTAGDSPAVERTRTAIAPVLDFLESVPEVPIARDDVALVLPISIRSDDDIPADLLAIKENVLASPPPSLSVASVEPHLDGSAVLRGTVRLPSYLDPVYKTLVYDPDTGRPVATGAENVPFVLRLPPAAAPSPAPIVMYQHGNPGSPEEITRDDQNGYLPEGGFAVAGIRDYLNRKIGGEADQITATFFFLLQTRAVPGFWSQTGADMIAFLRALQGLGGTAWRPATAPQAPLLDPTRLLYHGISEGGNNALRFLPFAPELIAATPTVGGGRLVEILLHQDPTLLSTIEGFVGDVRPVQILVGLSLFQHGYDAQDPHSFARFVNRAPLAIPGLPGARPPSILWTEGIGDTFIPGNASRSAVRELGIPSVRTLRRSSPVLTEVDAPLRANLAPDRTSGHFQYASPTTPGCSIGYDGHFCPQSAPLAQQQRLHFFQTALQGPAPEIVDPIP